MHTNILIIEDNLADVALIEAYLKTAAFRHTLYASDSLNEGLRIIKESAIGLVLLDLKLADTEGFQTLRLFREKAPEVPVIVLTGFRNEVMGIQSVRAGAQDFLVKGDFDAKSLVRSIRYALQRFETQSKLQEKAKELSQSQRRNQLAHQIARFGKWEMDIVNNAMTWDDQIFQFFGFPPQSFAPSLSDYLKYVQVEDRSKVERFFEAALKDGQPHSVQHRIVIDNTVVKHLQVKAQVNYDKPSNRILLMGVVQDITDSQAARAPLPAAKAPAPAPALPAGKDLFTEFDFDWHAPLSAMSSFLTLLEKTGLDSQQQSLAAGLKNALGELSLAFNNWHYLRAIREGALKTASSPGTIQEIAARVGEAIQARSREAGLELELGLQPPLPPAVMMDKEKIAQIVYNLLEVTVRNSPAGAAVKPILRAAEPHPGEWRLWFSTYFSNSELSAEEARVMLEQSLEYFDAAEQQPCCLLTAVAARLAQAMGGAIEIHPAADGAIQIAYQQPLFVLAAPPAEVPAFPQVPIHILLVEDHDLQRLAIERVLKAWSSLVSVELAENGKQAVEKTRRKEYDLILMDLQMPGIDGFEAAIRIRRKSAAPIIALSLQESAEEQARCAAIGIGRCLVKPVPPETLFAAIMQTLYAQGG